MNARDFTSLCESGHPKSQWAYWSGKGCDCLPRRQWNPNGRVSRVLHDFLSRSVLVYPTSYQPGHGHMTSP